MKAEIQITLNKAVWTPKGKPSYKHCIALVTDAQNVRIGKVVHLEMENQDPGKAVERLSAMSEKLLANPVMEDFNVKIIEEEPS